MTGDPDRGSTGGSSGSGGSGTGGSGGTGSQASSGTAASNSDRRSNVMLRSLIDEMLDRVREMNRASGMWTAEERARAEAELDSIMARVRRVAAKSNSSL